MSHAALQEEKVIAFVPKEKTPTLKPKNIMRWHTIAGLCLLHGFRKGAELGVSQGRFTMFLCATMHDMKIIAVDMWAKQPQQAGKLNGETYEEWPLEENYKVFKRIVDEHFADRVTIKRMDTVEASKEVEDNSLDFVFIDADHTYEGCKRDIEAWSPKVRHGGMISGHDYTEKWPAVRRAVDEAFEKKFIGHDGVWVVFKK